MAVYTVQDTETKKNVTFEWNDPNPPTDADMEEVFKAAGQVATPEPKEETFMQKTAPYVRPVLEFGGMIGGGLAGAAATGPAAPAGAIAGAAGGYAMGKEAANLYEQSVGLRQPENLLTERGALNKIAETGQNIVEGATIEAGGLAAGKAIGAAAKYATTKLPSKLYGSAIKAPITKRWTEVLPSKEVSKRMSAISAGLEKKIYPTEHGLATVTQLEKQTRTMVDDIVSAGATKGDIVATKDIVEKGLKKAYDRALKSSDPIGAKELVDDIAEKFMAHGETIPTKELNAIKRQLYDEVKWGGSEATALAGQIKTMGKKGLANEAMVSLESFYPQLKELNKTDASYIALKEAVERATARIGNRDIVGLTTKVLGVRSIPGAIFEWTLGHPLVKSRLAFSLHSAGKAIGTVAEKRIAIEALGTEIKTISNSINKYEQMSSLAKEGDKTAQEYIAKHNKLSQELYTKRDELLKRIKVDESFQPTGGGVTDKVIYKTPVEYGRTTKRDIGGENSILTKVREEPNIKSGFLSPEEVAQRNMARGNQQSALFEQKRRGLLNRH